ncbi:hypothetical protein ACTD5D_32205 [Nocardia takedensis]|uniref:hypothetical protein n=1 Tax=Nocardia takedensis TaxID=259390 RepID=UPI003F75D7D5
MLTNLAVAFAVVATVAAFWSLVVNLRAARRHRAAFEAYTNAVATLEAAAGTEVDSVDVCLGNGRVTRLPVVRPGGQLPHSNARHRRRPPGSPS